MMSPVMQLLDNLIKTREADIRAWFDAAFAKHPPFFYGSVDLRHSGHKLAPVDTNLFPAGFDNLSQAGISRAVEQTQRFFRTRFPGAARVLIVPESHTRNLAYLDNLVVLRDIITAAGFEVVLGSLAIEHEPLTLASLSGHALVEQPLIRQGDIIKAGDFVPDVVLVNNDMTSGSPVILQGLSQPVMPPTRMGWYRRRKSVHFAAYDETAREFARVFDFDPWLIAAHFNQCGMVNFRERTGLECVAVNVEKTLHAIRGKYQEYGIKDAPYVFIKADSGTYGMGIMTAHSGDELYDMNKKLRNKMDVIKEGVHSSEVIVQEGVPTMDSIKEKTAEPMIYMIGGQAVGGAYRLNANRDNLSNLNAAGMEFTGMCDELESNDCGRVQVANCNFCVYGLVTSLAGLAATREEYVD